MTRPDSASFGFRNHVFVARAIDTGSLPELSAAAQHINEPLAARNSTFQAVHEHERHKQRVAEPKAPPLTVALKRFDGELPNGVGERLEHRRLRTQQDFPV
jgi:hypothetical protein